MMGSGKTANNQKPLYWIGMGKDISRVKLMEIVLKCWAPSIFRIMASQALSREDK